MLTRYCKFMGNEFIQCSFSVFRVVFNFHAFRPVRPNFTCGLLQSDGATINSLFPRALPWSTNFSTLWDHIHKWHSYIHIVVGSASVLRVPVSCLRFPVSLTTHNS